MKKNREKYYNARRCAKERGIEWNFTFDTWIKWWGNDIINRGPYKGQLVMARYNDIGPYEPNNVRKITCTENQKEAHDGKKRSAQTKINIGKTSKGRKHSEETKLKMSIAKRNRDAVNISLKNLMNDGVKL